MMLLTHSEKRVETRVDVVGIVAASDDHAARRHRHIVLVRQHHARIANAKVVYRVYQCQSQ